MIALLAAIGASVASQGATRSTSFLGLDDVSLYIAPHSDRVANEPELQAQLLSGPHEYFRFINGTFSRALCQALRGELASMPRVSLHGDAHLEQYAVTDAGRGLTDFDDTATGPAVIDLVRFGVSTQLATREHRWPTDSRQIFRIFLDGYRDGLEGPEQELPEPTAAKRMLAEFDPDPEAFFAWAESLMAPIDDETRSELEKGLGDYAAQLGTDDPSLPARFFEVVHMGSINLGIGSALDEKYLVRLRGPSDDPLDDIVVEAKEDRRRERIECVTAGPKADPFRILVGQVLIPYRSYLGHFQMAGKPFWVHAWIAGYKELDIRESVRTPAELAEIAYESGVQLARAHFDGRTLEASAADRARQEAIVTSHGKHFENVVSEMTDLTLAAWRRFRAVHARAELSSTARP
jgi:hypothetical protein